MKGRPIRYAGWVENKDTGKIVWSDTHFSTAKQRDKATFAAARKARKEGKNIRVYRKSYSNV